MGEKKDEIDIELEQLSFNFWPYQDGVCVQCIINIYLKKVSGQIDPSSVATADK